MRQRPKPKKSKLRLTKHARRKKTRLSLRELIFKLRRRRSRLN